jgi:ArsR family transcriptional regulator
MKTVLEPLKALSDRNRLRTVAALAAHGELCACQITELLGVSGATASRHMAQLIRAGLVQSRKESRWVHYRLSPGFPPPLLLWIRTTLAHEPQLATDRKTLQKITGCKR